MTQEEVIEFCASAAHEYIAALTRIKGGTTNASAWDFTSEERKISCREMARRVLSGHPANTSSSVVAAVRAASELIRQNMVRAKERSKVGGAPNVELLIVVDGELMHTFTAEPKLRHTVIAARVEDLLSHLAEKQKESQ